MRKTLFFLIFVVVLSLFLGCTRTYIVQIHQGINPTKPGEVEQNVEERALTPEEQKGWVVKSGSNVTYIFVTAEVPHTVTSSLPVTVTPLP